MGDMVYRGQLGQWNSFEHYNVFFNPNICHVCKKTNINLKMCSKCCLISYCNDQHQLLHREQHSQFCEFISKYLKGKYGEAWRSVSFSTSEWVLSRIEIVHEIQQQLPRKLQTYEKQMITFAKSCYFCHKQDLVRSCSICYSAEYCIDHELHFREHHLSQCRKLLLCLNLNYTISFYDDFPLKFTKYISLSPPEVDMITFILHYVSRSRRNVTEQTLYFYSDYLSGPLTLFYALEDANLSVSSKSCPRSYIVHVISAAYLERKYVAAWELLLHVSIHIKQLVIVLVGPDIIAENGGISLCSMCKKRKQTLRFETYSMIYHTYASHSSFQPPDIITIFNADLGGESISSESLVSLDRMCPLLLTATSKSIAKVNISKIEQAFEGVAGPVYNVPNKFASIQPLRDFRTNSASYYNTYVTLYEHLLILDPL